MGMTHLEIDTHCIANDLFLKSEAAKNILN